jgi:DNA-directed RNA polymerase subunit RPC12/RpoP
VKTPIVTAELADARIPHGRPCEKCGAPVEVGDRFCNGCGQTQGAEPAAVEVAQKFFRCESCGAEVAMDAEQRSYVCPFCDSTYVVDFSPAATGRQAPEFVIGFAIPPDQAANKFHDWLTTNTWFRPGDLKLAQLEGKLRGVYLPFWSFSMLAESAWGAETGAFRKRNGGT